MKYECSSDWCHCSDKYFQYITRDLSICYYQYKILSIASHKFIKYLYRVELCIILKESATYVQWEGAGGVAVIQS